MIKAYRFWKLIFTTVNQPTGAPFIDKASTRDKEGAVYESIAILLTPWRRNKYREAKMQKALVIGWRVDTQ